MGKEPNNKSEDQDSIKQSEMFLIATLKEEWKSNKINTERDYVQEIIGIKKKEFSNIKEKF